MPIPKKIHYCWLSGEAIPADAVKCVNTWKKIMPEYELVLWDKNKFDITSVPFLEILSAVIVSIFLLVLAFGPYLTGLMDKKNTERKVCPLADKKCKGCFYWLESGDVCYYPKMINGLEKRGR